MPSDIHDSSPAKARRLRIVRGMLLSIAILLPLAAIAAIVGWFATGVFESEVQIVEVQKVVTVEVPVEVEKIVGKTVTKIVVATPTPTPAGSCPNDAERGYLTSLGHVIASRDNAQAQVSKNVDLINETDDHFTDPNWRESMSAAIATQRASLYDVLELRAPSSAQGINDEMTDWARYELAALDIVAAILIPPTVIDPNDLLNDPLLQEKQDETQRLSEARDASRESAFQKMAELCDSPSALAVFRAAYDGQTSTTATVEPTATPTPRPIATPRSSAAGSATVSGMGTSAKKVTLPRGTYEVEVQWENNVMRAFGATTAGIIQVQLLNIEDFGCRFLVIGELAASGSQTHFCEHDGGELRIQVDAQAGAEWTIRFVRDSAS